MTFESLINAGKVKRVVPSSIRAASLLRSSSQAVETAMSIPLSVIASKTILRELYEGLREYCESIGYLNGYKFLDHESIVHFLNDKLKEQAVSRRFDRYRRLRNGINYYGEDIDIETVKEAIVEIPELIKVLERHSKRRNQ